MGHIFVVTFPFFALVLCGWLATSRRMLPMEAIPGLNAFVLFFALPCMLYRFASTTPIMRLLDPSVSLIWLLCALAMVALAVFSLRGPSVGWTDASFGALPNSGFIGVPLLVALLGVNAAGPAIVALAIDMVFTSSLCIALSRLGVAGQHGSWRAVLQGLKGMLANPLPWSIALGCLTAATGWRLPAVALRTVEMLAEAASPAALFTLGALLARSRLQGLTAPPSPRRRHDVSRLVIGKVVVHPALVFVAGSAAIAIGAPLDRLR